MIYPATTSSTPMPARCIAYRLTSPPRGINDAVDDSINTRRSAVAVDVRRQQQHVRLEAHHLVRDPQWRQRRLLDDADIARQRLLQPALVDVGGGAVVDREQAAAIGGRDPPLVTGGEVAALVRHRQLPRPPAHEHSGTVAHRPVGAPDLPAAAYVVVGAAATDDDGIGPPRGTPGSPAGPLHCRAWRARRRG